MDVVKVGWGTFRRQEQGIASVLLHKEVSIQERGEILLTAAICIAMHLENYNNSQLAYDSPSKPLDSPSKLRKLRGETKDVTRIGKISVLVLTYNRKEMLLQCLKSVFAQVEPADEVIVLDNGSTDGTCDYLEESGMLDNGRIVLYRRPENTGASAGVDTLFRLAKERGSAWIWYMDDDAIADADALMQLKSAYRENFSHPEEVGFLKSVVISPDGNPNGLPEVDLRASLGQSPSWASRLDSGLVKVRWATFVSILIPRSTLTRIGNIHPDFVIYGEDIDFTLRTTEVLPGYLVGRSKVTHLSPETGRYRLLVERDPKCIDRAKYFYRNNLYFRWHYYSFGRTLLYVCKCFYEAARALGAKSYPLRRVAAIMGGLLSGLVFVLRPKAGPLHLSPDQLIPPLQHQRKPVPDQHACDG